MAEAAAPSSLQFPVSLNVAGKPCLIVGGGPVAARKARSLLACDAQVTVIAPDISPEMAALGGLRIERRPYGAGDVDGFRLVITATGLEEVDSRVFDDAEAAGIWVNSADDVAHCSFTLPSLHRDGAVTIAVSTGGASPALATWLRARLADDVEGAGALATALSAARAEVKAAGRRTEDIDWVSLLDGPLPELLRQGRHKEAQALIQAAIGPASPT
ncbi:MAG TPA: NAD(P)-dependent oxidoreductase [Acidimicrobiales bacterium]|jgi:siroheme synthase-like protein